MATKEELEEGLERVVAKYEDLKSTWAFRRFNKTVQFMYPDLDLSFVLEIQSSCNLYLRIKNPIISPL